MKSALLLTVDDWNLADGAPPWVCQSGKSDRRHRPGRRASMVARLLRYGSPVASRPWHCAPGIPDLDAQERRDNVPTGVYTKLAANGSLSLAQGLRVQPPSALWEAICEKWGVPVKIVCDRFRVNELRDSVANACTIEPRVTQWSSQAAPTLRGLRKICRDGPLSVDPGSRESASGVHERGSGRKR